MIPTPLTLLAQTLAFGDRSRMAELMAQLLSNSKPHFKSHQKQQALEQAIESRYSRHFRANETSLAVQRAGSLDSLDALDALFDAFFRFDGDHVVALEEKRCEYAAFCARLHPAVPVARHLAMRVRKAGDLRLDLSDLRRVIDATYPNFLPLSDGERRWAELHVHLGGSTESSLSLLSLALRPKRLTGKGKQPSLDFERVPTDQLGCRLACYQFLFRALLRRMLGSPTWLDRQELARAWRQAAGPRLPFSSRAWLRLHGGNPKLSAQLAASALRSYESGDAQCGWLYWLTALFVLFDEPTIDLQARAAVHAFLNLAQLLREDMIHDGLGLRRFVRYFASEVRNAPDDISRQKDGLRQLLAHPKQLAELKVGPWVASGTAIAQFVREGSRLIYRPIRAELDMSVDRFLPRWHFCVHFQRRDYPQRQLRYHLAREQLKVEVERIDRFMRSSTSVRVNGQRIEPRRLLRGLDAAGDELAVPNEVFAPSMRWLRRGPQRARGGIPRAALPGLHISIHAGEDYDHILGGLRHIDEAVRYCEMRQGDRLGHALALGIRPQAWIKRQPDVLLHLSDHLDNLVWAWQQAQCLCGRWPGADAVSARLLTRINAFATEVYPDISRCDLAPAILWQAWLLRRNCPLTWRRQHLHGSHLPSQRIWVPDCDLPRDDPAYRLYTRYLRDTKEVRRQREFATVLILQSDHLPDAETIQVDRKNGQYRDWIADCELNFIEAVQDALLTNYARHGLIIEVNPSSNVYIGRIDGYHDHPVFRWRPPHESLLRDGALHNRSGLRKGPMPVVVSSDDPGIFPTNLANEFELLKLAAVEHHDVGMLEAERWIEEMRAFGVEKFMSSHVDPLLHYRTS